MLCVSLNSPHSERPPEQTAGPSNLPFWILGNHYRAHTHKNFHFPGISTLPAHISWHSRKVKILVHWRDSDCQESKRASCLDQPFGQAVSRSEGCLVTRRALGVDGQSRCNSPRWHRPIGGAGLAVLSNFLL